MANDGSQVLVLYKVVNSGTDGDGALYNAFHMPRGRGLSLAAVKQHCAATRVMSHAGADGYHWRVRVDEKSAADGRGPPQYSWWDVQDEKAKLPIKDAPMSEIERLFSTKKRAPSVEQTPASKTTAKATRMLGKAMNAVANAVDGPAPQQEYGPRMSVIAFKLLDLGRMESNFNRMHFGGKGSRKTARHARPRPAAPPVRRQPAPAPAPVRVAAQPVHHTPAPAPAPRRVAAPAPAPAPVAAPVPSNGNRRGSVNLMGFDAGISAPAPRTTPTLSHTTSAPSAFNNPAASSPAPKSRLEKLQEQYKKNEKQQNRVWDPVDERWVTVGTAGTAQTVKPPSTSAPPTAHAPLNVPKKKTIGIKLDESNAAGKSANVQSAVKARVDEMKKSQEDALKDLREREAKKKQNEDAEDAVRVKLEPKIKAWSEEHGKKKQLRALLSSLHTILWPGANWKPVNLGDILDDSKCKRAYHKASRVVHPDKTHQLEAEQRFLAKRIFDALSQAKTEFDG
mmetsp:Transcript_27450/g.40368  ORF Transcript_27450/g.40368 Transcript_27450/m.40368 type:complete len:508 (-) Transcript_27450:2446-3969(-)